MGDSDDHEMVMREGVRAFHNYQVLKMTRA